MNLKEVKVIILILFLFIILSHVLLIDCYSEDFEVRNFIMSLGKELKK